MRAGPGRQKEKGWENGQGAGEGPLAQKGDAAINRPCPRLNL